MHTLQPHWPGVFQVVLCLFETPFVPQGWWAQHDLTPKTLCVWQNHWLLPSATRLIHLVSAPEAAPGWWHLTEHGLKLGGTFSRSPGTPAPVQHPSSPQALWIWLSLTYLSSSSFCSTHTAGVGDVCALISHLGSHTLSPWALLCSPAATAPGSRLLHEKLMHELVWNESCGNSADGNTSYLLRNV